MAIDWRHIAKLGTERVSVPPFRACIFSSLLLAPTGKEKQINISLRLPAMLARGSLKFIQYLFEKYLRIFCDVLGTLTHTSPVTKIIRSGRFVRFR